MDLPIETTYEQLPQHVFTDHVVPTVTKPLVIPSELTFKDLLHRTLHLLSVGSKRYFVHRFDRSITGLIASQPVCFYSFIRSLLKIIHSPSPLVLWTPVLARC